MSGAEKVRIGPSLARVEELLTVEAYVAEDGTVIGDPVGPAPEDVALAGVMVRVLEVQEMRRANAIAETRLLLEALASGAVVTGAEPEKAGALRDEIRRRVGVDEEAGS